ncbi:multidrug efflux MFS transporter periplasmic adaptor subunit EmrA [Edwardsiella anguillarum]|uniref:multidrug efflux MFS transporter periplasmic adaptor subunit EmrA n=1 Tax=Edwardsiella TaxID=635 RepID=UPI00045CB12B|nr:multidrug efflux MFS transporter periplasmic adaptor subunit EmrA [Edwardsiella anguillarum]AKM47050.1 multidrug transporter [Edwardsiella sp. EA181011]GAJ67322.1 multidrug resistance protein A [Edwardsiella piscicida]RFT04326.1 multidrug export protein EmrA [Edwardsiella anguillarum]WHP79611.1 multidrug efflux MFS transporter periplasmic adaptor subunit EmrA [Edwardsiella anguillarum]WHQ17069.1 multidrug efflux MFS transporter periplasmic adaptor subunit EmrA [Edwardsiella anguillarum]
MSENLATQATLPPAPNKKKQRKTWMLGMTGVFILIAAAYLVYWFIVLRHHQETDDAYVTGNLVQINAQVSGSVTRVNFEGTDLVKAGDILVTLDKTDAQQAYERAKTALANSVRQTHQLMVNAKQYQANIAMSQVALSKASSDYQRRLALSRSGAIGREELQHAQDAMESARAALDVAVQQYNANQALILNTPLEKQPAVLQAAAQVRDAWLALERTQIRSPVTGYVSQRSVQVGAQISPNTPLMAIVPASQMWIDANFKETQLANMRIGQPATVVSDMYGDGVVFKGKVAGLDMGTGSAFSLLPAQNATGNWIKVVQRLPVRIELDPQQLAQHPLRIGLSTLVTVDTANTRGEVLAQQVRKTPAYQSNVLTLDLAPVNREIAGIIQANAA